MAKFAVILAIMLGLLVLGVASDRPAPPADLTYIEPSDINTLDPQRMSYMQDFRLSYALYETLVRWDLASPDLRIIRGAAERWDISDDGLVYTFHLDPKGRWSNGGTVRARDFIYAWQRALVPDTAADYTKLFFAIRGARAFFDFRAAQLKDYASRPASERSGEAASALRAAADARFASTVGLEAVDDLTLRVTLEHPTPYFLDLCAFGPFNPVHPPTVEAWVDLDPATGMIRQRHGWTKPPHLVGNGPYTLERWRFKREMRLERSMTFREPGLAKSSSIRILCIEDQNTAVLAFKTGVADLHIDLDVEYIGDLLAQVDRGERDDLHHFTAFGSYFWSFNCTPRLSDGRDNPFHSPGVRRAFCMATDKEAIIRKVRRSAEHAAASLIPPGSFPDLAAPAGLPFDAARARAELAAAGWVDRDGDGVPDNQRGEAFPVVELLATPVGPHRDVAQAMARMWEEALGIRTKVIVKETKVYRNTLKNRDYMVARGIWYGDYLDPLTFLDIHKTDDGNNDRGYTDARFDGLLAEAAGSASRPERASLLAEAERYTAEESLPVLPLWHFDQYYLYHPPKKPDGSPNPGGIRGMSTHPRLIQYLFNLEVVR